MCVTYAPYVLWYCCVCMCRLHCIAPMELSLRKLQNAQNLGDGPLGIWVSAVGVDLAYVLMITLPDPLPAFVSSGRQLHTGPNKSASASKPAFPFDFPLPLLTLKNKSVEGSIALKFLVVACNCCRIVCRCRCRCNCRCIMCCCRCCRLIAVVVVVVGRLINCLLYTSPSPRD